MLWLLIVLAKHLARKLRSQQTPTRQRTFRLRSTSKANRERSELIRRFLSTKKAQAVTRSTATVKKKRRNKKVAKRV